MRVLRVLRDQADVDRFMDDLVREFRPAVDRGLDRTAEEFAAEARATAPVLTGKYRDSIEAVPARDGAAGVRFGAEYSAMVQARSQHLVDTVARAPRQGRAKLGEELRTAVDRVAS